ncbi:MAG: NAD(+) diphosphatase [Alphaproteobacteria bacterium]|nr:NAD(+) diphosphatase [Alphaproteobacteria bacterium]
MPSTNYYTGLPLDRSDHVRRDQERLASLLRDPRSRFVPVWRARSLIAISDPPRAVMVDGEVVMRALQGRDMVPVLLGIAGEVGHFAVDVSHLEDPGRDHFAAHGEFMDLRSVGALMPQGEGSILAYARGLLHWHSRHGFCGVCGSATRVAQGGHVRRCTNEKCKAEHFPRTDPAVIMLVHSDDHCLLGHNQQWTIPLYSTLAGFVEPGESLEEAVVREVREETGVRVIRPRYHSSQPWPFPSSLMLGYHAEADSHAVEVNAHELKDARWFHRDDLKNPDPDRLRLPRVDSIARRLIEDWLQGRVAP